MAWTDIPNLALAVGSPPTSAVVTALRDNPVAIAEGTAGAPRVEAIAQAGVFFHAYNVDGSTVTNPVVMRNLSQYGGMRTYLFVETGLAFIDFSVDNGATWVEETDAITGSGFMDFASQTWVADGDSLTWATPNVNAIRFKRTSGGLSTPIEFFAWPSARWALHDNT